MSTQTLVIFITTRIANLLCVFDWLTHIMYRSFLCSVRSSEVIQGSNGERLCLYGCDIPRYASKVHQQDGDHRPVLQL